MDALKFTNAITIQPKPSITKVCYLQIGSTVVTSITRHFDEDDARRCQLCPHCSYFAGSCTVMVDQRVTLEDAKLYDLNESNFVLLQAVVRDGRTA